MRPPRSKKLISEVDMIYYKKDPKYHSKKATLDGITVHEV